MTFNNTQLNVQPNPSDGKDNVSIELEKREHSVLILLRNIDGRVVYKKRATVNGTFLSDDLNLTNLTPGLYVLSVQTSVGLYSEKVVIE